MVLNKKLNIGIIGLGWLGMPLAEKLVADRHSLWGTKRIIPENHESIPVTILTWDGALEFNAEILEKVEQSDLLIFTVPPSGFEGNEYASLIQTLARFLPLSSKMIFTSSIGIYPDKPQEFFEDEANLKAGKLHAAENSVLSIGNRGTILRLGGLIGEKRNPVHYLVKKTLNQDPDKPVHLAHLNDIIQIIRLVISKNFYGEILNVVNPLHPCKKQYYTAIAKQLNLGEVRFENGESNVGFRKINSEKLVKVLGFNSFTPLLPMIND